MRPSYLIRDIPSSIVARIRTADDKWLSLDTPNRIYSVSRAADLQPMLADVEDIARRERCYVAGFVTYEAAGAFSLRTPAAAPEIPLAWFAVFPAERGRLTAGLEVGGTTYAVGPLTVSQSREEHAAAVATIKRYLADGDSYQVNHTFRLHGPFGGDPDALFAALVAGQRGRYAMCLHTPGWSVLSASPELFFAREPAPSGMPARLLMRPMKGTAPRAASPVDDLAARERLRTSVKEQAENVMVVDMVRNDLGRIAECGSVAVPELFAIEAYPTVWQMTSTVTARSAARLPEIFAALHPCGSVTGAPKARTMEIIAGLETSPRGVYTGAIGYLAPDGEARFAVAIRTAVITHAAGDRGDSDAPPSRLSFGVGSGIVWDSEAGDEYDECLLKARMLTDLALPTFDLLETLKWSPDEGYVLLDRHLERLGRGAADFNYPFDPARVRDALASAVAGHAVARRVRLLLAADGSVRVEQTAFTPTLGDLRLRFAREPIDTSGAAWPFLVHKTTRRDVYNQARAGLDGDCDDVVLWNAAGEVTETTVCNIVLETAEGRVTPPLSSGLLPGTLRAALVADGTVREAVITTEMLRQTGWCWLVNSLHGWRRGVLAVPAEPGA